MKLLIQPIKEIRKSVKHPVPRYIKCVEDKWTYFYLNRGDELLISRSPLGSLCVLYGKIVGPKKLRVWYSPKENFLGTSFILETLGEKGVLRRFTPQGRKHKGRRCDAPLALAQDEHISPKLSDSYKGIFQYRNYKAKRGERMKLKYLRSEGNVHHIGLPNYRYQITKDKQGK
jgi:hypothetical protein